MQLLFYVELKEASKVKTSKIQTYLVKNKQTSHN